MVTARSGRGRSRSLLKLRVYDLAKGHVILLLTNTTVTAKLPEFIAILAFKQEAQWDIERHRHNYVAFEPDVILLSSLVDPPEQTSN